MRLHLGTALLAAAMSLGWTGSARASDEIAPKLCSILADLVADTQMSADDAKTAFGNRLADAFYDTPQLLGQVFVKGDAIATEACPDGRDKFLAKVGDTYLSHVMP